MINKDQEARQAPFDLIWRRFPERQVKSSSVWWFFLLFPEQAQGYGPKQAMFAVLSIAGNSVRINHQEQPGLQSHINLDRDEEQLGAAALGWFFDGSEMHGKLVHESCQAILSPEGSIRAWTQKENGEMLGGELRAYGNKPFGILAKFSGAGGSAQFEAWGDPSSNTTAPAFVYDYNTIFGGYHIVTWRHLRFAGEIVHPNGTEPLEGIGYFQRVCLNIPLFPWKWIWATFQDESVFSCFIPYAGLHLLRRRDRFFPEALERATIPLRTGGYFSWGNSRETVEFDKARVTPIIGDSYPGFAVECGSATGDFIRYEAIPYSHAQLLLDRPILKRLWNARFNYNEYPFRVTKLEGIIGGKALDQRTLGNGFGNCEYTWGLGLSL